MTNYRVTLSLTLQVDTFASSKHVAIDAVKHTIIKALEPDGHELSVFICHRSEALEEESVRD